MLFYPRKIISLRVLSSPRPWGCFWNSPPRRTKGESSPRPWGCFFLARRKSGIGGVFPTPVGVFLMKESIDDICFGLPHARGGVSVVQLRQALCCMSSPRPWGCFCNTFREKVLYYVFPTPVGVFLQARTRRLPWFGLPHARGGVSPPRTNPPL